EQGLDGVRPGAPGRRPGPPVPARLRAVSGRVPRAPALHRARPAGGVPGRPAPGPPGRRGPVKIFVTKCFVTLCTLFVTIPSDLKMGRAGHHPSRRRPMPRTENTPPPPAARRPHRPRRRRHVLPCTDPLTEILRNAVRIAADGPVRRWLLRLLRHRERR